jgi:hypothetical protein
MNVPRTTNIRQDVVAAMQKPANGTHAGRAIGAEAKKP